jgi:hypothetical protein
MRLQQYPSLLGRLSNNMAWPSERHFELKLEEKLASLRGKHHFTESLILAQDERWRRA